MLHRVFALLCLCALPLTSAAAQSFAEHHSETIVVNGRWTLHLHNEVGDINVIGWDQPRVQVDWDIRSYSKSGLDVAWVEIDAENQQVNIRTAYPIEKTKVAKARIRASGPDSINYVLHIPSDLRSIDLSTNDGNLNISGIQSDVQLFSMTGTVTVENASGNLDLSTLHARQTIRLADVAGHRSIQLKSVNGSIRVLLSPNSDVKVEAASASGGLANDFGWAPEGTPFESQRTLRGTLGKGDASLNIDEVNGSITIASDKGLH